MLSVLLMGVGANAQPVSTSLSQGVTIEKEPVYLLKLPYKNVEGLEKGCQASSTSNSAGCADPCNTNCDGDTGNNHCGYPCDDPNNQCISCFKVFLRNDGKYDIFQENVKIVEGAVEYDIITNSNDYGSRAVTWDGGTYLGD